MGAMLDEKIRLPGTAGIVASLIAGGACALAVALISEQRCWAQASIEARPILPGPQPQEVEQPGDAAGYDYPPPDDYYTRTWKRWYRGPFREGYRRDSRFGSPAYRHYVPHPYPWGYAPWAHPGSYAYGFGDAFGFDGGYYEGHRDGRRYQDWQHRYERGLGSYLAAMENGNQSFREGSYGEAVRHFTLAAKLNQSDAASRLHLVHALVAVSHYYEAAAALRRAIQLQPKLIHLPLDIRSEYGNLTDFESHRRTLEQSANGEQSDADRWLLLGYYDLFSGDSSAAREAFQRATALAPGDPVVSDLLEAARLETRN